MNKKPLLLALGALGLFFAFSSSAADPDPQKASFSEVGESAMQPLESDPIVLYKASSLATMEPLAASVTSLKRTIRYSQEVVVENLHASISVCVYSVAAGAACTTDTDATCLAAGDPKPVVAPGKSRKFRFAGTRDLCAITSAIAGKWQSEVSTNLVGAR